MTSYTKPHLSYQEQIQLLKTRNNTFDFENKSNKLLEKYPNIDKKAKVFSSFENINGDL